MKYIISVFIAVLLFAYCSSYQQVYRNDSFVIDTVNVYQIDSVLKSYNIVLSPSEATLLKDTTYCKNGDVFSFDNNINVIKSPEGYILNKQ